MAERPSARKADPGRWRTWGLATLAGVLYFTGFAGFDQFYLTWIAFVPLLFALEGKTPRQALKIGAWMGLVTNFGGYYWLVGFMQDFSGFPLALGIVFNVILCAYQGGVFAVFCWIVARGRDRLPTIALVPVANVFVEFTYPLLFPSFTANSQHQFPLVLQIADLVGPLGVSAVVVLFNAALYRSIRERRAGRPWPTRDILVALGAVAATMVYGVVRIGQVEDVMKRAPKLTIGIAQSNMGIYQKWDDPREGLRRHRDLSRTLQDEGVDLLDLARERLRPRHPPRRAQRRRARPRAPPAHAAPVRRGHREGGRRDPPASDLQHRPDDRRRGQRPGQVRQDVPARVRRVPALRRDVPDPVRLVAELEPLHGGTVPGPGCTSASGPSRSSSATRTSCRASPAIWSATRSRTCSST